MYAFVHLADVSSLFTGFGINALAFLSQLVSFGIVFLLLWRWGFPLILSTLDRRQAVIREGIENAEKAKTALEEATARAEAVNADARRQAQETIAQAQKAAEREANRIMEENRRPALSSCSSKRSRVSSRKPLAPVLRSAAWL